MKLEKDHPTYQDLVIVVAWPDATMRGDERWMMFFKKIGIVKNLNFKVGHTAVILVDSQTKELRYYDFGRYISPRGHGRARSVESDPRLRMDTKADIDNHNNIRNLKEIIMELDALRDVTQGVGRIFFSVAEGVSIRLARQYADGLVRAGSSPYGAVAWGNNNCSRFITRLLIKSSPKYHLFHSVRYPETIKASPMSNVVNVRPDRRIYSYEERDGLRSLRMNRFGSFWFLLRQLKDNVSSRLARALPDDEIIGAMEAGARPSHLPDNAQWLGGVGEGAWYTLETYGGQGHFLVSRFTERGEEEYSHVYYTAESFDPRSPFQITYDSHLLFTTVLQGGRRIRLHAVADVGHGLGHGRELSKKTG